MSSSLSGRRALAQSRRTRPGVSSPESVVRSMQVIAFTSHAACHSFLTDRRVVRVAARSSTALALTPTLSNQSGASGAPGLRGRLWASRVKSGFSDVHSRPRFRETLACPSLREGTGPWLVGHEHIEVARPDAGAHDGMLLRARRDADREFPIGAIAQIEPDGHGGQRCLVAARDGANKDQGRESIRPATTSDFSPFPWTVGLVERQRV